MKIGLVGCGKIARDQHCPAIARTAGIELVAVADPAASLAGVDNYPGVDELLAGRPDLDAVALCQPPQARFAAAVRALTAGKHVLLEKPPGAAVSEVEALVALARRQGVALFAAWHSRHAAAVAEARPWIADRKIHRVTIAWKEDARVWHPRQTWLWEPGGLGVFDPGVNALSILTHLMDEPLAVMDASLQVPSNRAAPIAATLELQSVGGATVVAEFDFRQSGPQLWDIAFETDGGRLTLSDGGNRVRIDGVEQAAPPEDEYGSLYRRFVDLTQQRRIDVDVAPLRLVADAFLRGRFVSTDPYHE